MDHIATVKDIYAAFGRGDIPAILDRIAPDVEWDPEPNAGQEAGVPWLAHRTGHDGVAGFFASLEPLEFPHVDPHTYLANDNQVAVIVALEARAKGSGDTIAENEVHLWTFDDDGLVSRYQHYVDTARHIALAERALVG
jgi:ketosteroid isomerase-like protein